ncbi:hypothetical protein [Polaribacter uvawellassae]|uniref:hypothetical protein n=1 Tax=Polaribacter uvawellassae TaxID=3133495 RepID=UPI00321952FC
MSLNATTFIKNRTNSISFTQQRINKILTCVIISYEKIIAKGVTFDYSKKGKVKKEDYLRNRLVDDYLEYELEVIDNGTNNFTINKETSEEYINLVDKQLHDDPIDIHIVDYALKNAWSQGSKPYFAIECKRLKTSISGYIDDTIKASKRSYSKFRLPFEGQLGFIENKNWSYINVSNKVKKNLASNTNIVTTKNIRNYSVKNKFNGSYVSNHQKINNNLFSIYHLFLDYSNLVVN